MEEKKKDDDHEFTSQDEEAHGTNNLSSNEDENLDGNKNNPINGSSQENVLPPVSNQPLQQSNNQWLQQTNQQFPNLVQTAMPIFLRNHPAFCQPFTAAAACGNQPQNPCFGIQFAYPYPVFPGGHQPRPPPPPPYFTSLPPVSGGGVTFTSTSTPSFQSVTVVPTETQSQEHRQKWEELAAQNNRLLKVLSHLQQELSVLSHLQQELSEHKTRLKKLEEHMLSERRTVVKKQSPPVPEQIVNRGRPKKTQRLIEEHMHETVILTKVDDDQAATNVNYQNNGSSFEWPSSIQTAVSGHGSSFMLPLSIQTAVSGNGSSFILPSSIQTAVSGRDLGTRSCEGVYRNVDFTGQERAVVRGCDFTGRDNRSSFILPPSIQTAVSGRDNGSSFILPIQKAVSGGDLGSSFILPSSIRAAVSGRDNQLSFILPSTMQTAVSGRDNGSSCTLPLSIQAAISGRDLGTQSREGVYRNVDFTGQERTIVQGCKNKDDNSEDTN